LVYYFFILGFLVLVYVYDNFGIILFLFKETDLVHALNQLVNLVLMVASISSLLEVKSLSGESASWVV